MSVAEQSRNFCLFFIIGLFIGFIFDLFRGFRKTFKTNKILVDLQDIIFLLISGFLFFRSVVVFNSGDMRFYLIFSTFSGILIYALTISESCVIIINVIFRLIKIIFINILRLLKKPIKFVNNVFLTVLGKTRTKEWQYWEISLNLKRFVEYLSWLLLFIL